MRKFVCATVVTVCAFSLAMADEIRCRITKIDGDKVTVSTKKKGDAEAKTQTLTLTADTKINKGTFDKETKSIVAGDEVKGGKTGLTKMLDKAGEKGVFALVITDGDKVKEIRIIGGKKKKKNQ